jgi:SWI/SNF-related matrix-associated actin-dependent regulator 1 of chromatin subfamily A
MTHTPTSADTILVSLADDHPGFSIHGGLAQGGDRVHRIISSWPGWRRSNLPGRIHNGPLCSVYTAPLLPSTALPLFQTKELKVSWDTSDTAAHREARELVDSVTAAHVARPANTHHSTERQPMSHQLAAIRALLLMDHCAILADDMGLGKTSTALWALQDFNRILIICPASVKWNWVDEVTATLGDANKRLRFVIDGTPKKRADIFSDIAFLHDQDQSSVVIINYDLLIALPPTQIATLRTYLNGQALICDEAHYVKSRKAERTKLVMELSRAATARLLLTGTPIRNTIEDLWTQLEIVAPGCYVSYHDFMNRHAVMSQVSFGNMKRPVNVVRGMKNVETLNQVLNCYQIRRKKEDVLNLPPKIHTYPQIVFDGPIRKVYDQMKQWATIELEKLIDNSEDGAVDGILFQPQAHSFVQAFMRLEQIAQGFLGGIPEGYLEKMAPLIAKHAEKIKGRPGELVFPKHPKLIWLRETVETIIGTGHQVVIFGRFNAPLQYLAEVYKAPFMNGAIPAGERYDMLEAFQGKQHQIFLCQVKIAEGFNLTTASDVIFLGRDWSPAINRQAEDRTHRIGQKGTVNVQIPIVRKTIEELIHRKLMLKDADAQQALRTVSLAELKEALA